MAHNKPRGKMAKKSLQAAAKQLLAVDWDLVTYVLRCENFDTTADRVKDAVEALAAAT